MSVTVHHIRPDVLPQMTRFVQVAGVSFTVHVTKEEGSWLAWHDETGCWGWAPTVDAALEDVALMLSNDKDWFCDGEGSRLYLYGRAYQRRAAVQLAFGEGR